MAKRRGSAETEVGTKKPKPVPKAKSSAARAKNKDAGTKSPGFTSQPPCLLQSM